LCAVIVSSVRGCPSCLTDGRVEPDRESAYTVNQGARALGLSKSMIYDQLHSRRLSSAVCLLHMWRSDQMLCLRAGCWAEARTWVGEFGTGQAGEVAVDGNRRNRGWDLRDSLEGERRRLSIVTA
jgi:hypothetical protein